MQAEQQIAKPTEQELAAFTYSVYDFISRYMCGKSLDEILSRISNRGGKVVENLAGEYLR